MKTAREVIVAVLSAFFLLVCLFAYATVAKIAYHVALFCLVLPFAVIAKLGEWAFA